MVVSDSVGGAAEWLVVEDLVLSFSFSAGVFDLLVRGCLEALASRVAKGLAREVDEVLFF